MHVSVNVNLIKPAFLELNCVKVFIKYVSLNINYCVIIKYACYTLQEH